MRSLAVQASVALTFLAVAVVAVANPFKSKIITGNDSALIIPVPGDHFLKITNFSQQGGNERGVVHVTLQGDTGSTGSANVLTATRIDFSAGANSQNFPEIANRVIIAGPAEVRVPPVAGATLFITYRKESDEGGGGGGGGGTPVPVVSPTPIFFSPTPTGTP
jgi:hypothetical protein